MRLTRTIATLMLVCALAGCKIGSAVFTGGDVISTSGVRHCLEGYTCEFNVEDEYFEETFTATPREGFNFVRWKDGDDFLCAGSSDPVCTVSLGGGPLAKAVAASGDMFYLIPEFECIDEDCPPEHFLQEAIDALESARVLVEEYVLYWGAGANSPSKYGVDLTSRGSDILSHLEIYPTDASGIGAKYQFYIVANVYQNTWGGTGLASFSLSGQTNSDGTMSWECVPTNGGNGSWVVPLAYLPISCRHP